MKQIESALRHIYDEFGLHHIEPSLKAEFALLEKSHNAIHEFIYLAPLCFPAADEHAVGWENKSAFLLYHWEVFNQAHSSSFEALCAHYNVAFILLRTTLELLLKGAFWECLCHKGFRNSSLVLDKSSEGKQIKQCLQTAFEASPNVENKLEQLSASIFDILGDRIEERKFRISIKDIVQQLDQWGIFSPIANGPALIYDNFYSKLSADIHLVPDKTDIGRRIASEGTELFEESVLPASLREYATKLHEIMDVAIVIELNILQDVIKRFESVRSKLAERSNTIEQLELKYSLMKIRELLK